MQDPATLSDDQIASMSVEVNVRFISFTDAPTRRISDLLRSIADALEQAPTELLPEQTPQSHSFDFALMDGPDSKDAGLFPVSITFQPTSDELARAVLEIVSNINNGNATIAKRITKED